MHMMKAMALHNRCCLKGHAKLSQVLYDNHSEILCSIMQIVAASFPRQLGSESEFSFLHHTLSTFELTAW